MESLVLYMYKWRMTLEPAYQNNETYLRKLI
jgi:hypothetical protein